MSFLDWTRKAFGREKASSPRLYRCGEVEIVLPPYHMLPKYQEENRLYDRFLPFLVRTIEHGMVVDVGANCGDSLAAMVSENRRLEYIAIEPDAEFFRYLKDNEKRITDLFPDASIALIQALISDANISASLHGEKGSKHRVEAEPGKAAIRAERLMDVLARHGGAETLRLIKSDVDGYDFDVIASARKYLEKEDLLLFFECQYCNEEQKNGFVRLLESLPRKGFSDFWFFDNYGAYMLHSNEPAIHAELLDYVWRQSTGAATRTLYYFDILASKPADHAWVSDVIQRFDQAYDASKPG